MVEGALVDYDTATRIESRKLAKIMVSQTAKNMIQAFFFDLQCDQVRQVAAGGLAAWKPRKVGVLGAGMMGAGIAYASAARGIAGGAEGRRRSEKAEAARRSGKVAARSVAKGRMDAQDSEASCSARSRRPATPATLAGLRADHRGGVREPRRQGARSRARPSRCRRGRRVRVATPRPCRSRGLAEPAARPESSSACTSSRRCDRMQLVEIIRGKADRPETLARAYDYVASSARRRSSSTTRAASTPAACSAPS